MSIAEFFKNRKKTSQEIINLYIDLFLLRNPQIELHSIGKTFTVFQHRQEFFDFVNNYQF